MSEPYRVLRFEAGRIPAGLLKDHRLKAGVWGELEVESGTLIFVDAAGVETPLSAGDVHRIESERLHHLAEADAAVITIRFYRGD